MGLREDDSKIEEIAIIEAARLFQAKESDTQTKCQK